MRHVSPRLGASRDHGGRLETIITATVPGGEPIELEPTVCQITKQPGPGVRFEAKITVTHSPDVYAASSAPGTIFRIEHGYRYARGDRELIPMGVHEVAKRPKRAWDGQVDLDLQDQWARLEECRFLSPHTVPWPRGRRQAIIDMVFGAIPDARIIDGTNDGGTITTSTTFDRDRHQAIADLAKDGELEVGFTADGAFEAIALPTIGAPVATFTDADGADIAWLSDEAMYERLYNAVRVSSAPPDNPDQPHFTPRTVQIGNPDHPRHRSRIGVRPYFYASPTITDAAKALRVASETLWRVTQESTRISVSTWGYPHLEPGDTVSVIAPDRSYGPTSDLFLVEKVTHDCMTNTTSFDARSMSDLPLQEEAT